MNGEMLRKYVGQVVSVYLRSGESASGVDGTLLECDDSFACVLGHNGRHFLLALNQMISVETDPPPVHEGVGTLPRPA